jgi:hypothetical protein
MSEEKLNELSLDILLELHSEATRQLLESKKKMDDPDVVRNYQDSLALIQKVLTTKRSDQLPLK